MGLAYFELLHLCKPKRGISDRFCPKMILYYRIWIYCILYSSCTCCIFFSIKISFVTSSERWRWPSGTHRTYFPHHLHLAYPAHLFPWRGGTPHPSNPACSSAQENRCRQDCDMPGHLIGGKEGVIGVAASLLFSCLVEKLPARSCLLSFFSPVETALSFMCGLHCSIRSSRHWRLYLSGVKTKEVKWQGSF